MAKKDHRKIYFSKRKEILKLLDIAALSLKQSIKKMKQHTKDKEYQDMIITKMNKDMANNGYKSLHLLSSCLDGWSDTINELEKMKKQAAKMKKKLVGGK